MERINAPEMTEFTGGPETPEKVERRFRRYVAAATAKERVFKIVDATSGVDAGSIGYWETLWRGETVYETGWAVLTEFQGRGLATAAVAVVADKARAEGKHRYLYAFPKTLHGASNAICRKAGFELLGECEFEYPPGHKIRSNEWRFELLPPRG
jgi:RimJ/RimL family protein N-acetyltransferase